MNNSQFHIFPLPQIKENPSFFRVQRRMENELFFVTSGYIVREYNFTDVRINRHDLHLSLVSQPSAIKELSDDIDGYYCSFQNSFLSTSPYMRENTGKELEFINSFLFQYPVRLPERVSRRIESNMEAMARLCSETKTDDVLIHSYLLTCILEIKKVLVESYLDFYPAKAFSITKQYYDLLQAHIEKEHFIPFYAQELKVTPNHLNKSIKSVTGKTALLLLNEIRLMEAKTRLRNTDYSISEIAFQLGFEDQSYFSRFFKKYTGITPGEFRKGI